MSPRRCKASAASVTPTRRTPSRAASDACQQQSREALLDLVRSNTGRVLHELHHQDVDIAVEQAAQVGLDINRLKYYVCLQPRS